MTLTPDAALTRLADLSASLDEVVRLHTAAADAADDALRARDGLARDLAAFGDDADTLGDRLDDAKWHDVAAAMAALFDRIAHLAGGAGSASDSKKRRRLDPAPVILDAFYGGLYYAGKAAWWSVKTAVSLSIAAGRLAAPHVVTAITATAAAIGNAVAAGIVKVEGYVRADGTKIPPHERRAPGEPAPKKGAPMPHATVTPSGRATKARLMKFSDVAADGTFEGYGSLFGELDDGGDIVVAGAFAASLRARKASGQMPKLLREHDPRQVIGLWTDIYEDDVGLVVKGRILTEVELGRETLALMRAGALDGLSIGYEVLAGGYRYETLEQGKSCGWYGSGCMAWGEPSRQVRLLTKLDLWEVSVVTFPMLRSATIDTASVKSHAAGLPGQVDPVLVAALARRQALIGGAILAR